IGLGDTIIGFLKVRERLRYPEWLALSYGLGAALLGVITLIVGRVGWLDPWFIRIGLAILASLPIIRLGLRPVGVNRQVEESLPPDPSRSAEEAPPAAFPGDPLAWLLGLLIAPFVAVTLLGSMLPATDFDVLEYHLEGPKEYYQAGRIEFLPHNVY